MLDRLRQPVTPAFYRRITQVALVLLILIVVTGAAVRLTGSGLGCTDWPKCNDEEFVATSGTHALIESWNRNLTGLVSISVVLAVLGSLRRRPRRRDLIWLSWGLVAGVLGQIILGGLVVLSDLNPWLVQGHFALSMLLVLDAVVLADRARLPDGVPLRPTVTPALRTWGRVLVGLAALVMAAGTLVTGSGPHSGSNEPEAGATAAERLEAVHEIRRLPIAVHDAARIHGITAIVLLAAAIWVLVQIRRHHEGTRLHRAGVALLTIVVLQGALGYTQYFTGVPPLLVGLHILGAALVWVAALHVLLAMRAPVEQAPRSAADLGDGVPAGHGVPADPRPYGDLVTGR